MPYGRQRPSCYREGGADGVLTPTRKSPVSRPGAAEGGTRVRPIQLPVSLWKCAHVRVPGESRGTYRANTYFLVHYRLKSPPLSCVSSREDTRVHQFGPFVGKKGSKFHVGDDVALHVQTGCHLCVSEWSYREAAGGIPESAREPSPVYTQLGVWARPLTRNPPRGRSRVW
jgi:hypothetical protein